MAKKSIRNTKKKFKAEQMRKKMQVLDVTPGFMASAKTFYDVVDFLGIDTNGWCRGWGIGIDQKMLFKQSYDKLKKVFPPAYYTILNDSMRYKILSSIHVEEFDAGHDRMSW